MGPLPMALLPVQAPPTTLLPMAALLLHPLAMCLPMGPLQIRHLGMHPLALYLHTAPLAL
jgi:hypothetical protein